MAGPKGKNRGQVRKPNSHSSHPLKSYHWLAGAMPLHGASWNNVTLEHRHKLQHIWGQMTYESTSDVPLQLRRKASPLNC